MMITPCRRRSYQDHRQYYENVKPKVITRWENGMPLIRNDKLKRRMSDTYLLEPKKQNIVAQDLKIDEESDDYDEDDDDVFNESHEKEGVDALNNSKANLNVVAEHFKKLFNKLENYTKTNSNEFERTFIQRQMKVLTDSVRQIDYMINDVIERGERLEKFFKERESGLDWSEWKK